MTILRSEVQRERLTRVRSFLEAHEIDAFVIPLQGAFFQEETLPSERLLSWLTGFSGSVGLAIVTKTRAVVAVDGRYTLQAEQQVGREFYTFTKDTYQALETWLLEEFGERKSTKLRIGVDAWRLPVEADTRLSKDILHHWNQQNGWEYTPITTAKIHAHIVSESGLVEQLAQQPGQDDLARYHRHPTITSYPEHMHGESTDLKTQRIVKSFQPLLSTCHAGRLIWLLNSPASIAWWLNVRGNELLYTPLTLSRMMVVLGSGSHISADWIIDPARVKGLTLPSWLQVTPPERFIERLLTLVKTTPSLVDQHAKTHASTHQHASQALTVVLDPRQTPAAVLDALERRDIRDTGNTGDTGDARRNDPDIRRRFDPLLGMRATLNATQIARIREVHVWDGVAMCRLLHWLTSRWAQGDRPSEIAIGQAIEDQRRRHSQYQTPSFSSIVGSGGNGAIVHYRATPQTDRMAQSGELVLIDSGGQYHGATTDITRTVAVDPQHITNEQRQAYTLVLKGLIAVSSHVFPEGTTGSALDALARQALWQHHLNYDHGTGHGINQNLSVHDGPQSLSPYGFRQPLQAGMIVSNEPGVYLEGRFGIRLENTLVVEMDPSHSGWLRTSELALVPFSKDLIDLSLLLPHEQRWVDSYHRLVQETIQPHLEPEVSSWLARACAPLHAHPIMQQS